MSVKELIRAAKDAAKESLCIQSWVHENGQALFALQSEDYPLFTSLPVEVRDAFRAARMG